MIGRSRPSYEPLAMCGKSQARLLNLSTSKKDVKRGMALIEMVSRLTQEDFKRVFLQQRDLIKVVQSVLTETKEQEERDYLANSFAQGWFLGAAESGTGLALPGLSSLAALFALSLIKQDGSGVTWAGNAVEAGYFARRTRAGAEAFWKYLNEGAVYTEEA